MALETYKADNGVYGKARTTGRPLVDPTPPPRPAARHDPVGHPDELCPRGERRRAHLQLVVRDPMTNNASVFTINQMGSGQVLNNY